MVMSDTLDTHFVISDHMASYFARLDSDDQPKQLSTIQQNCHDTKILTALDYRCPPVPNQDSICFSSTLLNVFLQGSAYDVVVRVSETQVEDAGIIVITHVHKVCAASKGT